MPRIYFVIPSFYNTPKYKEILKFLEEFDGFDDFAVLSNVQLGKNKKGTNIAHLYNGLLNAASWDPSCEYVWTLCDGVTLNEQALVNTQKYIEENEEVGVAFPREMFVTEKGLVPKLALGPQIVETLFPAINCAVIRVDAFIDTGGFDAMLEWGHFGDVDWGIRCWKAGWRVVQYGLEQFLHEGGSTFKQMAKEGKFEHALEYKAAEQLKEKWPFMWRDSENEVMGTLRREFHERRYGASY